MTLIASVVAKVSQVQVVQLSRWDRSAWRTYRTRLDKPERMFGLKIRDKRRALRFETKAGLWLVSLERPYLGYPSLVIPGVDSGGFPAHFSPEPPAMNSNGYPQSRLNWTWPMVRRDRTPTINVIRDLRGGSHCILCWNVRYNLCYSVPFCRARPYNGVSCIIIEPSPRLGTTARYDTDAGSVTNSPISQHALVCLLSKHVGLSKYF